jgi:hypothetical protein
MLYREITALFSDPQKSHKYSLWAEESSMAICNLTARQTCKIILKGNKAGCFPEQARTR